MRIDRMRRHRSHLERVAFAQASAIVIVVAVSGIDLLSRLIRGRLV